MGLPPRGVHMLASLVCLLSVIARRITAVIMPRERTFIAIKPDGVQRCLMGEIIKRFEQKGFKLAGMKFLQASEDLLKQHYADLADKPFYPGLCKYMSSGPVLGGNQRRQGGTTDDGRDQTSRLQAWLN